MIRSLAGGLGLAPVALSQRPARRERRASGGPRWIRQCRRKLCDMRRVGSLGAGVKAEGLVEARRGRIVRAQAEVVESAMGGRDDTGHQRPAYTEPAVCRQDVQVADPADTVIAGVRIDIEAADPDQLPIDPRAVQSLARPVEPIRSIAPILEESADDPRPEVFAIGEQTRDVARRQIVKAIDDRRHAASSRHVLACRRAAHHDTSSFCSALSGFEPAAATACSAWARDSPRASSTEAANVPVLPMPAPQWIRTRPPALNCFARRIASDQNASRSSGTPKSGIGKGSTAHGRVFAASAAAYAGDLARISPGPARQTMSWMPWLRIWPHISSRGSLRPGMLWSRRLPAIPLGSRTERSTITPPRVTPNVAPRRALPREPCV